MKNQLFKLTHEYDIGDQSVLFTFEGKDQEEIADLAVYLQLKAEELIDDAVGLQNITIVEFLLPYGAKIVKQADLGTIDISCVDLHNEREGRMCANTWYSDHYVRLDKEYGETATQYLACKSKGIRWEETLI